MQECFRPEKKVSLQHTAQRGECVRCKRTITEVLPSILTATPNIGGQECLDRYEVLLQYVAQRGDDALQKRLGRFALELLPCVLIGRSALLTGGPARMDEATEQCLMERGTYVCAWAWRFV